jgi:hypothetical protein
MGWLQERRKIGPVEFAPDVQILDARSQNEIRFVIVKELDATDKDADPPAFLAVRSPLASAIPP